MDRENSPESMFLVSFRKLLLTVFVVSTFWPDMTATKTDPMSIGLDLYRQLILTDVEDIKAFFELVNSFAQEELQESNSPLNDTRDPKAFFQMVQTNTAEGVNGGGIFGTGGNMLTIAESILGAAAAASAAAQQPGAVVTSMTPAQQIINLRACPGITPSVCAPAGQCLLAGGVSIGNCAMGFLVCCTQRQEIPQGCSATNNLVTIREKLSTISNNDAGKSCQFEIYKADTNICQLQLDFDTFEMDPPLWGESCSPDSMMTISESITVKNNFPLCGMHNGTRLYLGYGRSSRISLSFATTSTSIYRIRVKQIDCKSDERIPDQCLQNLEAKSGLVKNFGFPQYMINDQKYTICIHAKALADQSRITWRECSLLEAENDSEHNFMLSEYFISDGLHNSMNETESYYNYNNYLNMGEGSVFIPSEGSSCMKTSYVEIHGEDRHCGAKFSSSSKLLRSDTKPYMLTVNVVEDNADNLPDFAIYRIRGLNRVDLLMGLQNPLPQNNCEFTYNNVTMEMGPVILPSTMGFSPCEIATKHKSGSVQYDLCLCTKKESSIIPKIPKPRDDMLHRNGFCLHYSVAP